MALWRRTAASTSNAEERISSLVNEHGAALLAYAIRLTGDRYAAEDVVQETLVRAWKRVDQLDAAKGSVRGWLLTVARNIVIDQARARASRPPEVPESVSTAPIAADHSEAVADLVMMSELLGGLSKEHRSVLVELYYRGRTVNEAAESLGVPAGTVKSRSFHAQRALRARLDPATVT
jgi:RNA polymerase sigma-70 factor (ECF subfamily)